MLLKSVDHVFLSLNIAMEIKMIQFNLLMLQLLEIELDVYLCNLLDQFETLFAENSHSIKWFNSFRI